MKAFQWYLYVSLIFCAACQSLSSEPQQEGTPDDSGGENARQSNALNTLAENLINNAPDSAFNYARRAGKIAAKYDQKDELARSYLLTGRIFFDRGAFEHAVEDYLIALKNYGTSRNEKGLAVTYQYLGLAYDYSKKPETALENYQRSLQVFTKLKDEGGLAGTISYIGHNYEKRQQYKEALEYQLQARQIYEKLGDTTGLAKVLDDIGSIYEDMENFSQAYENFYPSP
ncbi:MAG: tetratricopeptide repeat protein [Leadbetterella sp.]|nr:tetratricopeptide repeat protein [Leadbetterella sp.]